MKVVGQREGDMAEDFRSSLDAAWHRANQSPEAEGHFLHHLSGSVVVALLRQRPNTTNMTPEQNLVRWQRQASGDQIVPIFTDVRHLTIPMPHPATAVRVLLRTLLTEGGDQLYVINPLSHLPFDLTPSRLASIRDHIAAQSREVVAPSPGAPWSFRLPTDDRYPIALALGRWFIENSGPHEAYLYELTRGESSPVLVLGLNLKVDVDLANKLTAIAEQAGATRDGFAVRFLPEEPSHLAGVEGLKLAPFFWREREFDRSE